MPDRVSLSVVRKPRQIPWRGFNSFPDVRRERVVNQPALLIIGYQLKLEPRANTRTAAATPAPGVSPSSPNPFSFLDVENAEVDRCNQKDNS